MGCLDLLHQPSRLLLIQIERVLALTEGAHLVHNLQVAFSLDLNQFRKRNVKKSKPPLLHGYLLFVSSPLSPLQNLKQHCRLRDRLVLRSSQTGQISAQHLIDLNQQQMRLPQLLQDFQQQEGQDLAQLIGLDLEATGSNQHKLQPQPDPPGPPDPPPPPQRLPRPKDSQIL